MIGKQRIRIVAFLAVCVFLILGAQSAFALEFDDSKTVTVDTLLMASGIKIKTPEGARAIAQDFTSWAGISEDQVDSWKRDKKITVDRTLAQKAKQYVQMIKTGARTSLAYTDYTTWTGNLIAPIYWMTWTGQQICPYPVYDVGTSYSDNSCTATITDLGVKPYPSPTFPEVRYYLVQGVVNGHAYSYKTHVVEYGIDASLHLGVIALPQANLICTIVKDSGNKVPPSGNTDWHMQSQWFEAPGFTGPSHPITTIPVTGNIEVNNSIASDPNWNLENLTLQISDWSLDSLLNKD
ncbi:MAG: hypothetical protein ACYC56_00730, partial [Candidatus Aquicultor sp.]